MFKSKLIGSFIFLITFLVISYLFYKNSITEFPKYVHAWTQADRYALALGFLNNDHNLFLPETFNLIPDPENPPEAETGITPVDFPLHEFIISLIMSIIKNDDPVVFRIYILIYALTGLYFLFLTIYKQTNSIIAALASSLFIFSSPVYTYYANGFLPSVTSLSSFLIGIYFLFNYYNNKSCKDLIISMIFLTLAALSRKPFIIPLMAVIAERFFFMLKSKKANKSESIIISISLLFFVAYNFYNYYLESQHGSLFLSNLNPARNFNEFLELSLQTWERWRIHYLTAIHYSIIAIGIIFIIIKFLRRENNQIQSKISFLLIINSIGVILYFISMVKQFTHHDYYFLDSFFPVIILFTVLINSFITKTKRPAVLFSAFLLLSAVATFTSYNIQKERRQTGSWDVFELTKNNFINSDNLIRDLGISDNDKFLILNAYSSIPATIMRRKSFIALKNNPEVIKRYLGWDYDYVIIQNIYLADTYKNYPQIINMLKKIGGNDKLSVYKRSDEKQSLNEFLGLSPDNLILSDSLTLEENISENWSNLNKTDVISFSGKHSHVTYSDQEFSLEFSKNNFVHTNSPLIITLTSMMYINAKEEKPVNIVIDLSTPEGNIYYFNKDINDQVRKYNTWEECNFFIPIPALNAENVKLKIYFWNPNGIEFFADDIDLKIYYLNK